MIIYFRIEFATEIINQFLLNPGIAGIPFMAMGPDLRQSV